MKDKIIFFESEHVYYLNGKKVPSVGSILKRMKYPYNSNYWLAYKALQDTLPTQFQARKEFTKAKHYHHDNFTEKVINPVLADHPEIAKDYFEKRKEYINLWDFKRDNAAFRGTRFHKIMEDADREAGGRINPWTGNFCKHINSKMDLSTCDNYAIKEKLYDLEDGYYTELLVFDHELGICGQADMVWIETIGRYRYIWINDWKTNEKKPGKGGMDSYLPPFEKLKASKHQGYEFQINLYAYMLYRAGFKVKNLGYEWVKGYNPETTELVEFKFDKKVMEKICKTFL